MSELSDVRGERSHQLSLVWKVAAGLPWAAASRIRHAFLEVAL